MSNSFFASLTVRIESNNQITSIAKKGQGSPSSPHERFRNSRELWLHGRQRGCGERIKWRWRSSGGICSTHCWGKNRILATWIRRSVGLRCILLVLAKFRKVACCRTSQHRNDAEELILVAQQLCHPTLNSHCSCYDASSLSLNAIAHLKLLRELFWC